MAKHHPNKEVSDAIDQALGLGWRFILGSGHVFGTLMCPEESRTGCRITVFSTPKNPGNHARWIRRQVEACPHAGEEEGEKNE